MLDLSGEFGARVARRLADEPIIWLTTLRADGTPQPSPVWFLWANQEMLIFSQPNTQKLRNIARSPKVALHFDGDGQGGNIIVFTAEAHVDEQPLPEVDFAAYVEKYRERIAQFGTTPEGFVQMYSVLLRVTPTSVRGH
jgi:PPOX class probable F420-dependent enzyme